jgi:hypothetical protein
LCQVPCCGKSGKCWTPSEKMIDSPSGRAQNAALGFGLAKGLLVTRMGLPNADLGDSECGREVLGAANFAGTGDPLSRPGDPGGASPRPGARACRCVSAGGHYRPQPTYAGDFRPDPRAISLLTPPSRRL